MTKRYSDKKKERPIELTKSFMNEHGAKKKAMKVSWTEYCKILQKERAK